MKKSVVPYNKQTSSLFCSNCGGIAIDALPIKDVQHLARQKVLVQCALCVSDFAELLAVRERIKKIEMDFRSQVEELHKKLSEDVRQLNLQGKEVSDRLERIKIERAIELSWRARTN